MQPSRYLGARRFETDCARLDVLNRRRSGRVFRFVGTGGTVLCAALLLASCMSLEEMAPPVGPVLTKMAAYRGAERSVLEKGRELYLTDCARCHSVEPIARYTLEEWRKILPRMADESNLDALQGRAVEAYVLGARAFLATHPGPE